MSQRRRSRHMDYHELWSQGKLDDIVVMDLRPSAAALADPALPCGPFHLEHLYRRFFTRLDTDERQAIACWARGFNGHFCLNTACSGTELPVLSWRAFARVVSVDLQVPFEINSGFASEIVPEKQRLIRAVFLTHP